MYRLIKKIHLVLVIVRVYLRACSENASGIGLTGACCRVGCDAEGGAEGGASKGGCPCEVRSMMRYELEHLCKEWVANNAYRASPCSNCRMNQNSEFVPNSGVQPGPARLCRRGIRYCRCLLSFYLLRAGAEEVLSRCLLSFYLLFAEAP